MEKRRVTVIENSVGLVLVNDPDGPMGEELVGFQAWMHANKLLTAAGPMDVEDQMDTPHTAGLEVVRKDADGWYVRIDECDGEYPGDMATEAYGPCRGEGPEVLDCSGRSFGPETWHGCPACQRQEALDW